MEAVVLKSTGLWYQMKLTEEQQIVSARLKGSFRLQDNKFTNPIAVGDIVVLKKEGDDYIIDSIQDRKNYIIRQSPKHRLAKHVIASNLDLLVIVVTIAQPRTSTGFIDRILVTAEAYKIPVLIVINKVDLIQKPKDIQILENWLDVYSRIGYDIIKTSNETGEGLDLLKNKIEKKCVLIAGHSGVGKSSLLNHLDPSLDLRTNVISKTHQKGMHTTTYAEMHESILLDSKIIDTPGIKEFGVLDIEKHELKYYFKEMEALLNQCKFNNCLHINEPGCLVLEKWDQDEIEDFRYQNYLNILDDIMSQNDFWERK
jgi:ribosome biogenesis GTPase